MSAAGTLLGGAVWDGLVPFQPAHWSVMRLRYSDPAGARAMDEVIALSLEMSVLARAVILGGRPAAIVGLWLAPASGHPWIAADPELTVERLERVADLCRPFLAECRELRPLLCVKREVFDGATRLWLARLGFRPAPALIETWEHPPCAA